MDGEKLEAHLRTWQAREQTAEAMVPVVGRLYREHCVIIRVYGISLVNKDPVEIIKAHRAARQIAETELSVRGCYSVLQAVNELDLAPARIDIGILLTRYRARTDGISIQDFVAEQLGPIATGRRALRARPQNVVLYGFGRIGRLVARNIIGKTGGGDQLRLRAIVVRGGKDDDLAKRANLLRRDSVHGPFHGTIILEPRDNCMIANGNMIRLLHASSPEKVDYKRYGIDDAIVVDNTGSWRDHEGLSQHLWAPGVSRVVLTAPGKGDIPNIVAGVNHHGVAEKGPIISCASCTTNAIVPVLKALHDEFGIEHGHVETCHSYTNDQNLIDNYHPKTRRGRSAALNMVVTSTGAAEAVGKALPELTGKLTGNAIRVPTPNVSLAILNLTLGRAVEVEEVNHYLRDVSLEGPLQHQIDYTNSTEVVSSDFVGNRHAGIIDARATITRENRLILYVWYDNEYGYSHQVVRVLEELAGLGLPTYPQ